MVMRVASFFPFQATYYLNGHSYMEQELNRCKTGFRKNDKRVPGRRQRRAITSHSRPAQPGSDPQATGLRDPDPGSQVFPERTRGNEPVALLRLSTKSSTAATSFSNATFPFTKFSNVPVSWGCGV